MVRTPKILVSIHHFRRQFLRFLFFEFGLEWILDLTIHPFTGPCRHLFCNLEGAPETLYGERVTQTHRAASSGSWIWIDAFEYTTPV